MTRVPITIKLRAAALPSELKRRNGSVRLLGLAAGMIPLKEAGNMSATPERERGADSPETGNSLLFMSSILLSGSLPACALLYLLTPLPPSPPLPLAINAPPHRGPTVVVPVMYN